MSNKHTIGLAAMSAALLASACSSGGSSSAPTTSPTTSAASAHRVMATLTIKPPAGFHTAVRAAQTGARRPAYINPSPGGHYIDIFVNGTEVVNMVAVNSSIPNGTQTIDFPYLASQPQEITAVEYSTAGGGAIIAVGDVSLGPNPAAVGTSPSITVTMQMNPTQFVVASQPVNPSPAAMYVSSLPANVFTTTAGSAPNQEFFVFAADADGGYLDLTSQQLTANEPGANPNYGGTVAPALTFATPGSTFYTVATPLAQGGLVQFDAAHDPLFVTVTTYSNPAADQYYSSYNVQAAVNSLGLPALSGTLSTTFSVN